MQGRVALMLTYDARRDLHVEAGRSGDEGPRVEAALAALALIFRTRSRSGAGQNLDWMRAAPMAMCARRREAQRMRRAMHPAVFLAGAIMFCAAWLWLQPEGPSVETASGARRSARQARTSIELDRAILERYAGRYRGRADFTVEFSMKEGRLYAQSPGTVPFEMLPTSEIEFFLKESPDVDVKFRLDSHGAVTGFDATTPYGPMSLDRAR